MGRSEAGSVAVVGAGVVGTAIGLWLCRRGLDVVLIDRDEPGSGCSSGNSGAISPGSVAPLALPGVIASVPSMLLDRESPLHLPLGYLPQAAPWLIKFVLSAHPSSVATAAASLDSLHRGAIDMHRSLTRELGVPELFMERGHLHLYPDEAALAKDQAGWKLRAQYGYAAERLDKEAIRAMEPNVPSRYGIGMYLNDHATILNPKRYVQAMAKAFVDAGGRVEQATVAGLSWDGSVWSVRGAQPRDYRHVVVAAGAWSRKLLEPLGVRLSLESQRGYHVQFQGGQNLVSRTVVLADRKVFVTPMEDGLRVGGTVEIAGLERGPDFRRAQVLERIARDSFADLKGCTAKAWMGHRPCMPNSVPLIGSSSSVPNLWMAVGHGHLGLTDSLPTAERISQAIVATMSAA